MGICCAKKRNIKINNKTKDVIVQKINLDNQSQKGLFIKEQMNNDDSKKERFLTLNINNKDTQNSKKGNFISSKDEDKYYKILIGLNNIGATCYMNSTLQCLSNTKKLTEYFFTKFHFDKNDKSKKISNEFYILLKALWNVKNTKNKSYSPESFKNAISEENPLFQGIQANDSRDLINFLLERIHVELNFAENNQNISNILMNNPHIQTNKSQMLDIFIKDFQNNNKSIISDLFYGVH